VEEKMKLLSTLSWLCFICAIAVHAQTNSRREGGEGASGHLNPRARLQLTTNIVESRYCSDSQIHFVLRQNFTNAGQEPILLDKKSSMVTRYMVSRSFKDAAAKRYKIKVSPFINLLRAGVRLDAAPDEASFIQLKPGESYSLEKGFSLGVYDATSVTEDFLRPGNYVLQIVVWTWYYQNEPVLKWREQWRQRGFLWTDPVESLPMPFTVEKVRTVVQCPPLT
jgi:hypothetical protein